MLMNILYSNVGMPERENFSVQLEYNTWWLGAFKVDKESHEVLKWVFNETNTPNIIECQIKGQRLMVEGVGDFIVEWHLAADLKTLKCLSRCDQGRNAKFPCLYCLKKKGKQKNANSYGWEGGPLACRCNDEPNRDKEDSKWAPILKKLLSRVHICTLYVEIRVLDKLIHMHGIWVLEKIEDIFNHLRVQGGNVHIVKENELSGKSHSVPCKISI